MANGEKLALCCEIKDIIRSYIDGGECFIQASPFLEQDLASCTTKIVDCFVKHIDWRTEPDT